MINTNINIDEKNDNAITWLGSGSNKNIINTSFFIFGTYLYYHILYKLFIRFVEFRFTYCFCGNYRGFQREG